MGLSAPPREARLHKRTSPPQSIYNWASNYLVWPNPCGMPDLFFFFFFFFFYYSLFFFFFFFYIFNYSLFVMYFLFITTSVPNYRTLLPKSRELRKLIIVLNLFIITIVFTILSLKERVSLCFQHNIYC